MNHEDAVTIGTRYKARDVLCMFVLNIFDNMNREKGTNYDLGNLMYMPESNVTALLGLLAQGNELFLFPNKQNDGTILFELLANIV